MQTAYILFTDPADTSVIKQLGTVNLGGLYKGYVQNAQ